MPYSTFHIWRSWDNHGKEVIMGAKTRMSWVWWKITDYWVIIIFSLKKRLHGQGCPYSSILVLSLTANGYHTQLPLTKYYNAIVEDDKNVLVAIMYILPQKRGAIEFTRQTDFKWPRFQLTSSIFNKVTLMDNFSWMGFLYSKKPTMLAKLNYGSWKALGIWIQ